MNGPCDKVSNEAYEARDYQRQLVASYRKEITDMKTQRDELIEAAKEVLNHASGKSIDGTERPITDEDGCLKNWMEVLEMVRAALAKAGTL
jgi:hypothetical protein